MTPACGPCGVSMQRITVEPVLPDGSKGAPAPAWWCPKCHAWTPHPALRPERHDTPETTP